MFRVFHDCAIALLPRVRTWQKIDADAEWEATSDRVFPLIDIRCAPPVTDGTDGVTQTCNLSILVATNGQDDQTHEVISAFYDEVQTLLDALYGQFRSGVAGKERTAFDTYLSEHIVAGDPTIKIGGFFFGDPLMPYEDAGAYFMGLNFVIHFSRSDY
jgi:hypothetical protein